MPIRFATAPSNGSVLVQKGLDRLSKRNNPLTRRGVDFGSLQVQQPHAVYDLRADAVANGGLASATLSGFRYFVQSGSKNVAAAEVHATGADWLVAHFNYGPYVEATAQALTQVAVLEPVKGGSYEVRMLRFSAIALVALWLKSDTGGDDFIYPVAPVPPGLEAGTLYTEDDFLNVITPLAQKRAANTGQNFIVP